MLIPKHMRLIAITNLAQINILAVEFSNLFFLFFSHTFKYFFAPYI